MSLNKVAWLEGMLVRPQHFQQGEYYWQSAQQAIVKMLHGFNQGFYHLKIDKEALVLGKVRLLQAEGLLPDGTWLNYDSRYDSLLEITISEKSKAELIYLCLAERANAKIEKRDDMTDSTARLSRYRLQTGKAKDTLSRDGGVEEITYAEPNLCLMTNQDDLNGYCYLPILKIAAMEEEQGLILADSFMPSSLNVFGEANFRHWFETVLDLFEHKQKQLLGRIEAAEMAEVSISTVDSLLLQIVNRVLILLQNFKRIQLLHPYTLYQLLIAALAELAVYTSPSHQIEVDLPYYHSTLIQTFAPLKIYLAELLYAKFDQQAIAIALHQVADGFFKALLLDGQFMQQGRYILAVSMKADLLLTETKLALAQQIKIASADTIEEILNLQLPGVELRVLPRAPALITHDDNTCYLELDTADPVWSSILESQGLCIFFTRKFPEIDLKLWLLPEVGKSRLKTIRMEKKEELCSEA